MRNPDYETIIIGTGFGGLCAGYNLKQANRSDFLILEKAKSLGGTWRENTYPGAECDVPSALYSFSFDQNPNWNYRWSKQPQILEYMEVFSKKHDLCRHTVFNTEVTGAKFDEVDEIWRVETSDKQISCRYLVSAVGQLHHPKTPDIPGRDDFKGPAFHSAEWDAKVDLTGKNIGVMGSAASAVQFIPQIAKVANSVTVYQRSPNWITRKGDRAYRGYEKWLARYFPVFRKSFRYYAWWSGEKVLFPAIQGAPKRSQLLMDRCLKDMKKHIKDPEMQKALTPDFPIGAKRFLFSDNFYEALARDNVELETSGVSRITENGIDAKTGQKRNHDVLVFGTGFFTNPFLMGLDIVGRDGTQLKDHWAKGAFAYNGITTSHFPNLFFMYGPNTNTGHSSIILKLEAQAAYIRQLITGANGKAVEIRKDVEEAFDEEMQSRLAKLAWDKVEDSWYKDGDKLPNNWPGTTQEFQERLSEPDWNNFIPARNG